MTPFLVAAAILVTVAGVAGWTFGRAIRRGGPARLIAVLRALLVCSAVPLLLYIGWTWRYSIGWIDLERGPDPVGAYPGAIAFAAVGLGSVVGLLLPTLRMAPRWPRVTGLFPPVAFAALFHLALPLLRWQSPTDGVILDNMPAIWLFAVTLACGAFVVGVGWVAGPRKPIAKGKDVFLPADQR